MKRTIAITLVGFAGLLNISSASAQDRGVRATVPFNFNVGGQLLPANTYTITSTQPGFVIIQSVDKRNAAATVVSHVNRELAGGSKLVFTKYGDQYFLHEVLSPVVSMNVALPTSNLEKQTRVQRASPVAVETTIAAAE